MLATSKSNSIPLSRERKDHFRGRRGASPSLLIASKDLLSVCLEGGSEGGASVLIFRVVAQATCVKLKSTIALSIQHHTQVNLRAISVADPALQLARDSGLPPSLELVWIATGRRIPLISPPQESEGGRTKCAMYLGSNNRVEMWCMHVF